MPDSMAKQHSASKSKRVNLTVSLSDELYAHLKAYKAEHKVSLSAMAREFMRDELAKFERTRLFENEGHSPQ